LCTRLTSTQRRSPPGEPQSSCPTHTEFVICDCTIELLFKRIKQCLRLHEIAVKDWGRASSLLQLNLIGWWLQEQEAAWMRGVLTDVLQPSQETIREWESDEAPNAQQEAELILSSWRLSHFCCEQVRTMLRGAWTHRRLEQCQHARLSYVKSRKRQRGHRESEQRDWLQPVPLFAVATEAVLMLKSAPMGIAPTQVRSQAGKGEVAMQTLESILVAHPFFKGLDPRYMPLITGCAENVRYNAGEYIFREGEDASHFYIIREGKVALETVAAKPGPIIVQTIEAGEVLGWSWLFPPYRWHFSARVVEPTRAIALDGACLRAKGEVDHDLGYELVKRVAHVMMERLQATRLQLLDVYGVHTRGGL
jgi:CRP/FNR family cyclic AMP-dependent transcriptional regulator